MQVAKTTTTIPLKHLSAIPRSVINTITPVDPGMRVLYTEVEAQRLRMTGDLELALDNKRSHSLRIDRSRRSALIVMRSLRIGRKVGCHIAVVEMVSAVFCRTQRSIVAGDPSKTPTDGADSSVPIYKGGPVPNRVNECSCDVTPIPFPSHR